MMEIEPIVLGDPSDSKEFDVREAYEFLKNGSADTIAASFSFTEKRAADFLFSDTIYKVIFVIRKL
jgi:ABC-type amino acid transport substrate-binding protein